MALVLGLGALIPILFALGGNLPGYHFIWEHVPALRNTRVPERMMPIACLALAALVAFASRAALAGAAAAIVALLSARRPAARDVPPDAPTRTTPCTQRSAQHSPGRLLELPVFDAGSQSASVYLYYLMQAPHQHPSGYSTTAPLTADRRLRELQKTPCRYLRALGVQELVTHYSAKNPCGGRLIARSGRIAAFRVR